MFRHLLTNSAEFQRKVLSLYFEQQKNSWKFPSWKIQSICHYCRYQCKFINRNIDANKMAGQLSKVLLWPGSWKKSGTVFSFCKIKKLYCISVIKAIGLSSIYPWLHFLIFFKWCFFLALQNIPRTRWQISGTRRTIQSGCYSFQEFQQTNL